MQLLGYPVKDVLLVLQIILELRKELAPKQGGCSMVFQ